MKRIYRGYEVSVNREMCLGGWPMIYYSIFRESDGLECTSGFIDTNDSVKTIFQTMCDRIDSELASGKPWDEVPG